MFSFGLQQEPRDLSIENDVNLMCSQCEGIDRRTARLFLLGHHYEKDFVFETERAIKDWNGDKELRETFIRKLSEDNLEKTIVNCSFDKKKSADKIFPEATTLEDLIHYARTELPLPNRLKVEISRNQIGDFKKSLFQIAEQFRVYSSFYFTFTESPAYEFLSDLEQCPESSANDFPHFDGINFLHRMKAHIRIIDEESPNFEDEFIIYYFQESRMHTSRYWLFFDSSTPISHACVSEEGLFFGRNKSTDGSQSTFRNCSAKEISEQFLAPELNSIFSTHSQEPSVLLDMFHSRCRNSPFSHKRRFDQILFQKIKFRIDTENRRIAKLERLSGVKLKFEPASLEYFLLLKRGEKTTMEQPLLEANCVESLEFFDIFTHEQNILQSIVLFTNDWHSIISAKLVSRTWYEFLSNDNCYFQMQMGAMVKGGEEMLVYARSKVDRVYQEYKSLEVDFPIDVLVGFSSNRVRLTTKLHWSLAHFLEASGYSEYSATGPDGKFISNDQLFFSFFRPDESNRVYVSTSAKNLVFVK